MKNENIKVQLENGKIVNGIVIKETAERVVIKENEVETIISKDEVSGIMVEDELYVPWHMHLKDSEEVKKPKCKLIGADGNIFNLIGLASRALKEAGQKDAAKEMSDKVMSSSDYNQALRTIMEYVEVE